MPARPTIATINAGDFAITVSVNPVFGATFYTFERNGSSASNTTEPRENFSNLASGTPYSFNVTATKSTNYGNFTSEILSFDESTSTRF